MENHWRWKFEKTLIRDYLLGGPLREEVLYMPVHCFTHIDPPLHAVAGGAAIDEIPLSRLIGSAAIVDLSALPDNQEITADLLEQAGDHVSDGMVLIKTSRNLRYSIHQPEFWTSAPYMSESAGRWLIERGATAVGFDFPQDYVLRDFFSGRIPAIEEMTMHNLLLHSGVLQLEYLTNLDQLTGKHAQVFAIPLRLAHTAGAPARIFAQPCGGAAASP